MFWIFQLNILLKLISSVSFYFLNAVTKKFRIPYVTCMCGSCYVSRGQHFRASLGWSGPPGSKLASELILYNRLPERRAMLQASLDPWCQQRACQSGLWRKLAD